MLVGNREELAATPQCQTLPGTNDMTTRPRVVPTTVDADSTGETHDRNRRKIAIDPKNLLKNVIVNI